MFVDQERVSVEPVSTVSLAGSNVQSRRSATAPFFSTTSCAPEWAMST